MSSPTTTPPNYGAIKSKQNAAWASGDYALIGSSIQVIAENLAGTLNLAPPAKVLDVAAGSGNASMAFARRWHNVTSTDYVESLLEKGKARADALSCNIDFQTADAEALPFDDGAFDAVVSTVGVMFAPDQKKAAHELVRVCRPGGHIGLANWTAAGFIGQLFKVIGKHVPPPAGLNSPALWGDEKWLSETFCDSVSDIRVERRHYTFRYQNPEHFIDVFRKFYGPVHKAFLAVGDDGQETLADDIANVIKSMNRAVDGTMDVPAEYSEVVMVRSVRS